MLRSRLLKLLKSNNYNGTVPFSDFDKLSILKGKYNEHTRQQKH